MQLQVNKELVPMKAHYFLWNAGTGPVVPYLSVYARQLGYSSSLVGVVYTILPIFGMIAKPLFGAISDRFHCQKKIFLIAQLVTAAAFLSIFYAPKVSKETIVDFSCTDSEAAFHKELYSEIDANIFDKITKSKFSATCELSCMISSKDLNIICTEWKVEKYCDNSSNLTTNVNFLTSVPLDKTILLLHSDYKDLDGGKILFKVDNVSFGQGFFKPVCPSNGLRSKCDLTCDEFEVNQLLTKEEMKDEEAYRTYQFWVFLMLMVTSWIGQAIVVSISDAICFEMLGDKPNRYGYQRMYGALGWGILSLLTGVIVDLLSKDKSYTDYTACFYLGAAFLILDFFVSCTLKYNQIKISTNIFKDVGQLLVNLRIIVFLLWCICVGMCTGLIWQFLLWLVEDLAKAQGETRIKTLQGVLMGIQCLGGELPFFFLSGKILKKIGHVKSMSLVMFTIGVRFILYSVISNPWWFIPIEFSNGLTFGLFYACMASYASIVAPPGTEATMQGLVGAVFEGVGVSLGSFLAGRAIAKVSVSVTFRYFGIGILVACVLHLVAQHLLQIKDAPTVIERKKSYEKVLPDDQQELTSVDPLISK